MIPALVFETFLPFARAIYLLLAASTLLPALLLFLRTLDLLLSLLLPTLLPFGAVLLLVLATLFRPLLLLRLLLLPLRFAFLPSLVASGLVFLTPLLTAASSALGIREVACPQQRGCYRKRQSNLFDLLHFFRFLSVLTSGERSTHPSFSNPCSIIKTQGNPRRLCNGAKRYDSVD